MQLRVLETTDNQFIGKVFEVPFLDLTGIALPIVDDIIFDIVKYEDLGNNKHRYSSPHYVAICEEA
jgi:hypothetical protein